MTAVKVFRALVVLELVFFALSWILAFWEHPGDFSHLPFLGFVGIVWLFLIAVAVGVFLFNRVARAIYVVSVPAFIAVNFWFQGSISENNETLFDHLGTLCTGAILALMWLHPSVAGAFGQKQSNTTVETDARESGARGSL
jgi:hypothetical protein